MGRGSFRRVGFGRRPCNELFEEGVCSCDISDRCCVGIHSRRTVFAPGYAMEFAKALDLVIPARLIAGAFR